MMQVSYRITYIDQREGWCLVLFYPILLVNSLDGGFVGLTLNIDQLDQSFSNRPKTHSRVGYGGPLIDAIKFRSIGAVKLR